MVRHGERQSDNNYITQRIAAHIHAHPETIQTEQHCRSVFAKSFQHRLRRQTRALYQQLKFHFFKLIFHPLRHATHEPGIGEQHKRPPLTLRDITRQNVRHRRLKRLFVRRIRHVRRNFYAHLPAVVERRANLQFVAVFRADPPAEPTQVVADRQRRARHHHAGYFVEQHTGQQLRHVHRRRIKHRLFMRLPLQTGPVHMA